MSRGQKFSVFFRQPTAIGLVNKRVVDELRTRSSVIEKSLEGFYRIMVATDLSMFTPVDWTCLLQAWPYEEALRADPRFLWTNVLAKCPDTPERAKLVAKLQALTVPQMVAVLDQIWLRGKEANAHDA